MVEEKVRVELKAVPGPEKGGRSQVLNYLKIFELEVGLLLNFGMPSLEFKRFVYSGASAKSANQSNQ